MVKIVFLLTEIRKGMWIIDLQVEQNLNKDLCILHSIIEQNTDDKNYAPDITVCGTTMTVQAK